MTGPVVARLWRPVLLVALVGVAVVVAIAVGVPSVEQLRDGLAGTGWAGPLLWAALYAGLSLTPVPVSLLAVLGGVLFGFGEGLPATLAGKFVGAAVGFALARRLGRDTVLRLVDRSGRGAERMAVVDDLVRRRGVLAVVGVRLAPVLPYSVLNLLWGLTAVRFRHYLLGTVLGVTPGTTALVAVGAFGTDPGSLPFLVSVAGLGVVVLTGVVLARRRPARSRADPPANG